MMQCYPRKAEDLDDTALRIRNVLERQHTSNLGDICAAIHLDEANARGELDVMMARGEVECLRPVQLNGEQREFFRLRNTPQNRCLVQRTSWGFHGLRGRLRGLFGQRVTAAG